jgi:hypothetical protein
MILSAARRRQNSAYSPSKTIASAAGAEVDVFSNGTQFIYGMKLLTFNAAILIGFLLCGCNQSQKHIANGYHLERFDEGGTFFCVTAPGTPINGGGVFDGTVQEIGWNNDWILARVTRLYHGDTNGWYSLNLKTAQIAGPIPADDLKTNPIFLHIKTAPSATVFSDGQ